jgi:hypothetical protein
MVDTYVQATDGIYEDYEYEIGQWPSDEVVSLADVEREFRRIMRTPRERVNGETKLAHEEAKRFFRKSSSDFVESLSPEDRKIWQKGATTWDGQRNPYVREKTTRETLNKASSADMASIMLAALDDRVWTSAEKKAREGNWHSSHKAVDVIVGSSSCDEAKREMRCAFDEQLWKEALETYNKITDPDTRFETITQLLELASSGEVRQAMRAALDDSIYLSAKEEYRRHNNPTERVRLVEKTIRLASSEAVRQGMRYLLGMAERPIRRARPEAPPSPPREFPAPQPDPEPQSDHRPGPEPSPTSQAEPEPQSRPEPEYPSPESQPESSSHGPGPQAASSEAEQGDPLEPELSDEELEQLIGNDRDEGSHVKDRDSRMILTRTSNDFIRGVIKQINIERQKIRNSGGEPTDRNVWREFRHKIDRAVGDNLSDDKRELLENAYLVVNALMNGNYKGALPF